MAKRYEDWEREFVEQRPHWSIAQLVAQLPGRTYQSVKSMRKVINQERKARELRAVGLMPIVPESDTPRFVDHPILHVESALVLNDAHIPYHDAVFMNKTVDLALAWDIRHLVLGGDFLSTHGYNSHGPANPDEPFEMELEDGERTLTGLIDVFDSITWIKGNHEDWAFKQFANQIKSHRFLRMLTDSDKVTFSSYGICEIRPPSAYGTCECCGIHLLENQYPWIVTHQKSAPTTPAKAAYDIANVWTWAHVICAHDHLRGFYPTKDGKRKAVGSGACADVEKFEYSQKLPSSRPRMTQGAVLIVGQDAYLVEPNTDFEAYKRMYGNAA